MIIVCVSADDESGAPPWRPSLLGAANHSPESKRLVVGSGATACECVQKSVYQWWHAGASLQYTALSRYMKRGAGGGQWGRESASVCVCLSLRPLRIRDSTF